MEHFEVSCPALLVSIYLDRLGSHRADPAALNQRRSSNPTFQSVSVVGWCKWGSGLESSEPLGDRFSGGDGGDGGWFGVGMQASVAPVAPEWYDDAIS